jgi:hypothetical protein
MKIDILGKDTAAIILFQSLAKVKDWKSKILNSDGTANRQVDVCLTINGTEIDIISTINDLWDKRSKILEEEAAKRALEIITESGLSELGKIENILREARYNIQKKIESTTDYRFRDDD